MDVSTRGLARPAARGLAAFGRRAGVLVRAHQATLVVAAGSLLLVLISMLHEPAVPWLTWDSRVYWETSLAPDLYANARVGALGAYLYSPAFAQLLAPAGLLPWPLFLFGWTFVSIRVAAWLCAGPVRRHHALWLPLATLAILDIGAGNVNVLLGGAIVLAFRWSGAWSAVALTKVTPGMALAWYLVRREWRPLLGALAVTALVVGISAVFEASAWVDWGTVLLSNATPHDLSGDLAIPAAVRFPLGLALVAWGGVTGRRWVLPIAAILFLPVIWPNTLALLLASAALWADPNVADRDARRTTEGVRP
jgi:hypothetical protein